jgi:PAS domain S-box-containing protein
MLGYTEAELLTMDFQAITHPDDLDADLAYVQSLLAGEIHTYQLEKRYYHKDASIVSILLSVSLVRADDGSPLQLVSQTINITDQKSAETALRQSEEKYRLLADNATDTVFRLDLEGNCLYVSPSSRDLIGFDPEYLIGKYVLTRFHPDDAEDVIAKHRALASGQCDHLIVTYRSEPADRPGTWVWLESNCGLVRDPVTNEPREIIASIRDISERKALELQLESARREAEEAAAAKSRFLSNISHEIRTPMSGILGMIELLRGASSAREEARLLDGLDQSAQMLTTVLNDLLDYSKMESDHLILEEVDLDFRALLHSTFQLLATSASNEKRRLTFSFPQDASPFVRGDPARLRQIIANLLSNAIKFTPEGHIDLAVSRVAVQSSEPRWRIEVADTGIGIDAEKIGAIFSPFVQADLSTTRRFGGTGLGLAICRRLVEAMGGTIGVESTPGKGSLFWIEVTLAAMPSAHKQPSAWNDCASPSLDILLAEDNPVNQQLVAELIRRMGHQVTCVSDGRAAVEAFAAGQFDLVLIDMQMPEMDGPEAATAIRSLGDRAAQIPIVALSADEAAQRISRYHSARFDAFVSKPINAAKLTGVLMGLRSANGRSCDGLTMSQSECLPILDATTLIQLGEALGPNRVDRLLGMLSADAGDRSLAIKEMVEKGDILEARRSAHSLRGAALPLGAMRLAEAARLLEREAADGIRSAEELLLVANETIGEISCYRLQHQERDDRQISGWAGAPEAGRAEI